MLRYGRRHFRKTLSKVTFEQRLKCISDHRKFIILKIRSTIILIRNQSIAANQLVKRWTKFAKEGAVFTR
ncbi:hypothetical protein DPMN_159391 [Dreissena polymorpha]|uniref:Uncharacterized protein n=1 Tax=Dreissena polymorpha TaxID=45954 RepID=A0A9D4EP66_DREPO|nr:hypothetical protein DPMN_159391 [Dreissena polymorpha]